MGGVAYDLGFPSTGLLLISSFTLPAGGKNFSIEVPANFSVIATYFDVNGQQQEIDISRLPPEI